MKKINIYSNPEFDSPNKKLCQSIVRYTLNEERVDLYQVSIIFTSDTYVSDLKKKFFLKDQWTDVIAFPLHNNFDGKIEGDVYISMPTARENAFQYNQPYEKEVARLIIHGVLHLIGYHDISDEEKKNMSKMEEKILKEIKWELIFEKYKRKIGK
tara:strand:- start:297 stop:761 length:465 start_codon:yes stop_codon:yes gene_type:complete